MTSVTDRCLCGEAISRRLERHGLDMLECPACGVLRQEVGMSREALARMYREQYLELVYQHSYEHDREVAETRLDAYGLELQDGPILDVGAGNGAFVDACGARGLVAWGQDLARQSESDRIYVGDLERVAFPAHEFATVTMHDVLEHVPDPVATLDEVARVLRPGGRFILDFPRFHHESGAHHWKSTEHLWMLTERQLLDLLGDYGFAVDRVEHPIESKVVVYARNRRTPSDVKILVPPGIGDGYWVMVKLRGFLEDRGIYLPEVYVHDSGHRRAAGLWSRVPFVRFAGFGSLPEGRPERYRAYHPPGAPVQRGVDGFDYFVSFNGTMDAGKSLQEALPGEPRWYEPLFRPKSLEWRVAAYRDELGSYVATAFWDRGFYRGWLAEFGEDRIAETLGRIADAGRTPVLMGADWDRGRICDRLAARDPRFVSLVGDTTFDDLVALLEGADGVFGFPAGNTMLGPYLRRPTVLLWNGHFPRSFWTNACPPDAPYRPVSTRDADPGELAGLLEETMA